jgi:hypothetical protein
MSNIQLGIGEKNVKKLLADYTGDQGATRTGLLADGGSPHKITPAP